MTELNKTLRKINKLLTPLCTLNCPDKVNERCCDKMFCRETESHLKTLNKNYSKPNYKNVPYLSETGCIVPIEERPFCTMFACEHATKNETDMKKWVRLQDKAKYFLKENR